MKLISEEIKFTFDIFKRYWDAYGRLPALLKSPYLYLAFLVSGSAFSLWTKPGWWDLPLGILPNLIGFTLGGYAVWLSFGDIKFRAWLCKDRGRGTSIFMKANAAFVHFICVQIFSLIYAVVAKSLPLFHLAYLLNKQKDPSALPFWSFYLVPIIIKIGSFIGFCLFIYSILCGLAATMAVFRFSTWLEWHTRYPPKIRRIGSGKHTSRPPAAKPEHCQP